MGLSNAERQRRFINRLKERAAGSVSNGGDPGDAARIEALEAENAALKAKLASKPKVEACVDEPGDAAVFAKIVNKFGDTKWHALSAVVTFVNRKLWIECDEDQVRQWLDGMVESGAGGAKTEGRKSGASFEYRFYRNERMISSQQLGRQGRTDPRRAEVSRPMQYVDDVAVLRCCARRPAAAAHGRAGCRDLHEAGWRA